MDIEPITNRTLYGVAPSRTLALGVEACCSACANVTECGAWYAHLQLSSQSWTCELFTTKQLAHLSHANCSEWAKPTQCASGIAPPGPTPPPPSLVSVEVDYAPRWRISPYLSSLSLVYCWAPDAVYGNGSLARWAREQRVATARFPAGTASYWNWENPTGMMGQSTLNPEWNGTAAPADQWMSMEKYLDLCDQVGMRPLVGVNYNCKGHMWVNESESIARAERQVM